MKNKKTHLLAFNLIEMIITIAIISILASLGVAKFSQLKTPKEMVDEATNTIVNIINQTVTTSASNDSIQNICNMLKGSGTRAQCSNTNMAGNNKTSWVNINNITFNNLLTVTFTPKTITKFISSISYKQGLISTVSYTDGSSDTIDNTTKEAIINPITITVTSNVACKDPALACQNTILLYPNNATIINKKCDCNFN